MACYLVVISGSDRKTERLIPDGGRCAVGRSHDVDLHLDDAAVSRRHFTIADVDGAWQLTDLESSTGTFVNGEKVAGSRLIPGDRIRIGSTSLVFETEESRSDDATSADLAISRDLDDLKRFVGRTFQGYDLEEILAVGSRSVVFRARLKKTGRLTALKILTEVFLESEEDVQRFVRGINAAKEARDTCLVRLHAAGRKGRNCWVAMELVEGETLAQFIAREGTDGRLSPSQAIRLGIDMARALEAICVQRCLHRNVSPDNILYDTEQGLFKLNGLMWAKAFEGKWSADVTAGGQVLVDLRYYAPELLGGGAHVDARVDLYGLGATLYTALTGRVPIPVESLPLMAQVAAIRSQAPERLSSLRPDIPKALDAVVMKLLAKKPDDRYQTPAELLAELEQLAANPAAIDRENADVTLVGIIRDQTAGVPDALPANVAVAAAEVPIVAVNISDAPAPAVHRPRKPSRSAWLAAGGVSLLVFAVLLVVAFRPGRPKHPTGEEIASTSGTRPEKKTRGKSPARKTDFDEMASTDADEAEPEGEPVVAEGLLRDLSGLGAANDRPRPAAAPPTSMKKEDEPSLGASNAADSNTADSKAIAKLSRPASQPDNPGKSASGKNAQLVKVDGSLEAMVSFINQEIRQGWTDGKVQPSPLADDAEWLRRVHLDLIGRIPGVDVIEKFLADKSPSKRARMIDHLLDSDDYVHYWSNVWTNLAVGRRPGGRASRDAMLRYFRNAFQENRAWNAIVVELVSAAGNNQENGAVNFVLAEIPGAANDAVEITAKTTRLLMGVQVQCTQCHNHPFNEWQQRQFWEFNTFFRGMARVDRTRFDAQRGMDVFDYTELINNPVDRPVYFERRNGLMEVAFPKFFGDAVEIGPDSNRRSELARLMVAGERPAIALAMVNRMWGRLFGGGFTRPIDDMGPHNLPSHPDLLNRLAAAFVNSGYDVKQLIRWIVNCEAYHLTSRRNSDNERDNPALSNVLLFSHYYPKPVSPESLCESLLFATSAGDARSANWEQAARNRQLLIDQFLDEYAPAGDNDDASSYSGSIPQSLTLMNGELIRKGISTETGRFIPTLIARYKADPERIKKLYLTFLGREPDRAEIMLIMKHLHREQDRSMVYQNICWALINSNEFALNH